MALELGAACERCAAPLRAGDDARICVFECTFCPACAATLAGTCPTCGDELVPRPRVTRAEA